VRAQDLIALTDAASDPDTSWEYHFSDQALSKIVKALPPLKVHQSWVERQLNDTATSFVKWVLRGPNRLSRPKTRRELIEVAQAAAELAERLEGMHDDPQFLLQLGLCAAYPGNQGLSLYGAHVEVLRTLARRSKVASEGAHINRTGPEKDFDVGFTVKLLMTLFEEATGKGPSFYRRPSQYGDKDEPGSACSDFMEVFFELLPEAEIADLQGIGPVPEGPPRTVADAMTAAGFDRRMLKIIPNRALRAERNAQNKKARGS
jgi:hypothetical protein